MRSLFSLLSHLTALPCITGIDDDIHVGAVHQVFQDAKLLFGTSRHQIFIIYVENRFTQIILYLHGFTEKRLPILAESRETEFKRCFMGLH